MTSPASPMTWTQAVDWFCAQPENAALARAAYFDADVAEAAKRYLASAEFAALKAFLPAKPGRALDLGAGNGILSYALAASGWDVTAVEPDPSPRIGAGAIRALAEKTGVKIRVIEAFGEAIPLEEAGFDLVAARQVLHHAHDLPAFCREMARLSRPGAVITTLRDHVISGPEQLQPFLDKHPLHHLYGGENAFTLEQYRNALTGAGLSIAAELRSFQSVINYDPASEAEVRQAVAGQIRARLGAGAALVSPLLALMPFSAIASLASAVDRRPGRLVSFICSKGALT